jgi:membrane protein DedA with SNARE-associated domain
MMKAKAIRTHSHVGIFCAVAVIVGLVALSFPGAQRSHALPAPEPSTHPVEHEFSRAVAKVQPLLDRYGYAGVFLAITVEGMGLPAPGQTLLIASALTATGGHLSIVWVVLCAFAGAVLGNSLGYCIGRWGGRLLLHKMRVNEAHLGRMEGYFARSGKGLLLVARFFDGLRQLNGLVAGMLEMDWKVFAIFNILGAGLWTGVWGLGPYFLDREAVSFHLTFREIEPWIASLALTAFLALIVYLLSRRGGGKT